MAPRFLYQLYCSSGTLRLLRVLLSQPSQISYLRTWLNTYRSNALCDQRPWITFSARTWLESVIRPDMHVFEYGSGGSTLYFASRVERVVSVEHNAHWYALTRDELERNQRRNVEYLLCVPDSAGDEGSHAGTWGYTSTRYTSPQASFLEYVQTIDKYPDESFDLVFVDGRCRNACVAHAIRKVRRNGLIVLDNCEREDYEPIKRVLSGYKRRDFGGLCPYADWFWKTAAWTINDSDDGALCGIKNRPNEGLRIGDHGPVTSGSKPICYQQFAPACASPSVGD